MRGSLCGWKSFCRADRSGAGNQASLYTGAQEGWHGEPRTRLASSTACISSATAELAEVASSFGIPLPLGSPCLCDPSITPDLLLRLRALSSFSSHDLIPVLSSGPVVPYQLGLVHRGHVWQAGRAVSAGAPGASPRSVESRGRAELVSSHMSPPRAESGKFSSLSKTNFTGLKKEKLLGGP